MNAVAALGIDPGVPVAGSAVVAGAPGFPDLLARLSGGDETVAEAATVTDEPPERGWLPVAAALAGEVAPRRADRSSGIPADTTAEPDAPAVALPPIPVAVLVSPASVAAAPPEVRALPQMARAAVVGVVSSPVPALAGRPVATPSLGGLSIATLRTQSLPATTDGIASPRFGEPPTAVPNSPTAQPPVLEPPREPRPPVASETVPTPIPAFVRTPATLSATPVAVLPVSPAGTPVAASSPLAVPRVAPLAMPEVVAGPPQFRQRDAAPAVAPTTSPGLPIPATPSSGAVIAATPLPVPRGPNRAARASDAATDMLAPAVAGTPLPRSLDPAPADARPARGPDHESRPGPVTARITADTAGFDIATERLGSVRVALDAQAARLGVQFTVETRAAGALLDINAGRLADAVAAGGSRLDALSVDVRGGGGDPRRHAPEPQSVRPPPAAPRPEPRASRADRFA